MFKFHSKDEKNNISEADSWEIYSLNDDLIKGLELSGYYFAFNYFKEHWKKIRTESKVFLPYSPEENEEKNIVLAIDCLNSMTPHLFKIQFLILFSNDSKALEFYEIFKIISKKLKIKSALIIEENKIVDDKNFLSKENPEVIVGSVQRIDYVIKKHFLNVFMLKNLILDISIESSDEFKKELYEDILLMMPGSTTKKIFYEENEFFKKKYLKTLKKVCDV